MVEITRLFWRKVVTADGFVLGEIHSGETDEKTWQITHFYVSLTDQAAQALSFQVPFLGKVTVCLPVSTIKATGEVVALKNTLDDLRKLKECQP